MRRALVFLLFLLSACAPVAADTQDLYVDAQSARATADAAQDLAEYQERFLTATAEAPIVHITETAAAKSIESTTTSEALAIQRDYWTATAHSMQETQTAALTATAMAWTPTPNATSTAVFAALNAEGTQIANNVARDNLELERQKIGNEFWASMPAVILGVFGLSLILTLIWISRRERFKPAQVDERGNLLPVFDLIEGTVTDPDSMPNYRGDMRDNLFKEWLRKKFDLKPALPDVTPERQDAVKGRDQLTDLATRGLPHDPSQRERRKLAGQEATKQLSAAILSSRFKILDGETSNLEVIDGEIIKELDQAWKETG